MMSRQMESTPKRAGGWRWVCAATVAAIIASTAQAQPQWKTQITFPDEPYRVISHTATNPDWVKFSIKTAQPDTVYYQDSNVYTFHYDFVTAVLEPYIGISLADFEQIALYEAGQQLILGAVLMPASQAGLPTDIQEYGIQFVRLDPYPREQIVTLFHLVRNTVIGDPNAQAFYFPTFEQWGVAQENLEWFAQQGVVVSSPTRWAQGNAVYANGWALGEVKFVPGEQIADAYVAGELRPDDILLTDGVPAEVPFVAGIMSLTPSTPNSHVAILCNDYDVPFVHLAVLQDAELAQSLVGHRIVLRAYATGSGADTRLISVDGVLTEEQIAQILQLKELPPLSVQAVEPWGAYSRNTELLTLDDIRYFGGKASNYGFLRRAIPENNPVALGLSFDVWNAFMDQTLANGRTLREEISLKLDGHTWPPNLAQLADDLDYVRDLILNKKKNLPTIIPPDVEAAILATLQDPQYGFDPFAKIRFRSSTNVEDNDQFTGAGLYESYSGCLADDLDDDEVGPSWCDPQQSKERGVFRAIRKVFASFFFDNAFLERLRRGVNPDEVGMAILVHHSFPDEFELANGVAVFERNSPNYAVVRLVSQQGAVSVTNPEGGAIPEEVSVRVFGSSLWVQVIRYSSLVQLGDTVMDFEADYRALVNMMRTVADDYAAAIGQEGFSLNFEYKKLAPGGAAMPQGGLNIKQVRRMPKPDTTPSITPFLINMPQEYVTFQGEYGDVFANHRLKSQWTLATESMWMSDENLATGLYAEARMEYTDGCWTRLYADPLPQFPDFWHKYGDGSNQTLDGWTFAFLANPRAYTLLTPNVPKLVSRAQSPILTLGDLGFPTVTVTYDEPVMTWDYWGPVWRTTESIRLVPPPAPLSSDILQTRHFVNEDRGTEIHTRFYWPAPPTGPSIWTAPLVRWVETTITGLTQEPIVLHGWYSQTYRPGHHNFGEYFIFEPRLEAGISQSILDELTAMGVQYIYVTGSPLPGGSAQIRLFDDVSCPADSCFDNTDCQALPDPYYCRKAWGDCIGEGVCVPAPVSCPEVQAPVCGCDGQTYSNACYAAMAGVSVDYEGPCAEYCFQNADCGSSREYCAKHVGDCDGQGECQPRPWICPDVWAPVCGCDGQTYSNACYAAIVGVNVDYKGPCAEYCFENADCAGVREYCAKHVGDCDGQGECQPRPRACIDVLDPVCGCDGRTYSNACYAAMKGVNVKHKGPCKAISIRNPGRPNGLSSAEFVVDCDGQDECQIWPGVRIDWWDPLCGFGGNAPDASVVDVLAAYDGPWE